MTLYHASQYDWSKRVDSVWESGRGSLPAPKTGTLETDESVEVAIIGAGYCGLSAAYHLARAGVDVAAIDAGDIGWGASGRNAGFCSIGASFLGPQELKSAFGEDQTLGFYGVLVEAVQLVAELLASENIDAQRQTDGVWTFAHRANRLAELRQHIEILERLGVTAIGQSRDGFRDLAFACTEQFGAMFEPVGFGLNPLAYCLGLATAARSRGAKLYSRSPVTAWTREGARHRLITPSGSILARRVILATNGWMPEHLVPGLAGRSLPILSNIITTRPLTDEELQSQGWKTTCPASNTRAHLAYLRLLPDHRLLFGGRGDTTGKPSGGLAMKRVLERRLTSLFPALAGAEISHAWRGFICATRRLTPALGELPDDDSVSYAFGCHGNGVAFMSWAGRELARRITDTAKPLPAPLQGLPPRFPLPALRLWALRARLLAAWLDDELK